ALLSFLSVLSWIRLLNSPAFVLPLLSCHRFNPCCPGFGSSTYGRQFTLALARQVSIRVVLDSAPQRHCRPCMHATCPCFNPCCPGFGSSTWDRPAGARGGCPV